ncbi:hypothetical protein G6045_09405 [Streptomyces sp. YC504]|uniref:Uncharacterized protein n=1 Tax=Streptomyces mesophilus TaxID=1775132 RepID=A0A6G4XGD1_9ACTN|nr:hypothetical protein [Streptomyces mesophilus]NGO75887.1 hypothetical protein [Streptomyces mesophilus]
MSESDWASLVANTYELNSHWDTPPALDACDLFYVQMDERHHSVTLGLDAPLDAEHHEGEQTPVPNSVEFYLQFTDVERLRVKGWQAPGNKHARLYRHADGTIRFSADSEGSHLEFAASTCRLVELRARRVFSHD